MKKFISILLVLVTALSVTIFTTGCSGESHWGEITFVIHYANGNVKSIKGTRSLGDKDDLLAQAKKGNFATLRGYEIDNPGYVTKLYYYPKKNKKQLFLDATTFNTTLYHSFKDGKTIDLYEETYQRQYSVYYYIGNEPYIHENYYYGDDIVITDMMKQELAVATPNRHYAGEWKVTFWKSQYGDTPKDRDYTWTFDTKFSTEQDEMFVYEDTWKDSIWYTDSGIQRIWLNDYWIAIDVTAVFKPNKVNVRFNYNYNGLSPTVKQVGYNENLDGYFEEVKQEDLKYDFFGWYKDSNLTIKHNNEIDAYYEQDGNILDLYAKVKQYKDIKVNLGDGKGFIDAKVYSPYISSTNGYEESVVNIVPQAPTGKYFIGWSENEDGSKRLDTSKYDLFTLMESGKKYYAVYA